MDLFGDQSVQVVATLQAAMMLLSAALVLLLTARVAKAHAPLVPAPQPLERPVLSACCPTAVGVLLARCLPTRAPPDLSQRTCPSPPGVLPPQ